MHAEQVAELRFRRVAPFDDNLAIDRRARQQFHSFFPQVRCDRRVLDESHRCIREIVAADRDPLALQCGQRRRDAQELRIDARPAAARIAAHSRFINVHHRRRLRCHKNHPFKNIDNRRYIR